MKIFVTHYQPLIERKKHVIQQLQKYDLEKDTEFIVDFDREALMTTQDPELLKYLEKFDKDVKALNYAKISLFMKHIAVYRKVSLATDYEYALILEDDVTLCENFKDDLNRYMTQLPDNWDMCFLGDGCNLRVPKEPNKNIYFNNGSKCTDSYLISKKCAKLLVDEFDKWYYIGLPIDITLNYFIRTYSLQNFWVEPPITSNETGKSTGLFKTSLGDDVSRDTSNFCIYIHGFWGGFIEKTDGMHLGFFEELLKRTKLYNFKITQNIDEANVLLESIFGGQSLINYKQWKYTIHYSGESATRYQQYQVLYNAYDMVLSSHTSKSSNIIDLPLFVAYIHSNNLLDRLTIRESLHRQEIPPKFCCFVVTNGICGVRNRMFELLNQNYKKVDSAGNFNNNVGYVFSEKYWTKEQIQFISQYKFMICFENTKDDSTYITEKLVNVFLGRTIPIYWGSEYCKTVFNPDAFLYLENDTPDEFARIISEVKRLDQDDAAYLTMLNQPVFNKTFDFTETYGYDVLAKKVDSLCKHVSVCNLIESHLFYPPNKDTYPPFKNGLYLEEYFLKYMTKRGIQYNASGKMYIPALWTNFQIAPWFQSQKQHMNDLLNSYYHHPTHNGYFVVAQHDHGPDFGLPINSRILGCCTGDVPLPLIYQDLNHTLENIPRKSFAEKSTLCSFVGTLTHNVRDKMLRKFDSNENFYLIVNRNWNHDVEKYKQENFISATVNSKFALAPRGYGRSSFRFFEIFQLGTIPIYIWDDAEWLPYKELIDYSKICISIHVDEMDTLEERLTNITEEMYNNMIQEYEKIKHMFEMDYLCEYIVSL